MKQSENKTWGNNSHGIVITILEIIAVVIENYFKNKLSQSKYNVGDICKSVISILLVLFVLSALILSAWIEVQAIATIYMTEHGMALISVLLILFVVNMFLAFAVYFYTLKLKSKLTDCF